MICLMGGSNWNDMYNENCKNEIKSAIYFATQEKFVMEEGNFWNEICNGSRNF